MDENCTYYPAIYPGVILSIKVLTGVTSSISIAGACWIIITYFAFKDLQTTARQLLVNLSIADILVASSHFVGSMVNYERFIHNNSNSIHDPYCRSQAAVTVFGSISSFLWTMSIAIYMLALTLSWNRKRLKVMVILMYLICWGVPLLFVVIDIANKFLGFQYTGATGCYIMDYDDENASITATAVLSYELWVYLAYIFLPIIYLTVFCYIRCRMKSNHTNILLASTKTDIKLLIIPITFLLLRIWTTFDDAVAFYTINFDKRYRCTNANAVLLFFETVGINSQGTVNAILFCLLTKKVRLRWYHTISRLCGCKDSQDVSEKAWLEETVDLVSSDVPNSYNSINNTD